MTKELEQKLWYRILKVLYISASISFLVIAFTLAYSTYTNNLPYSHKTGIEILCSDSKSYINTSYSSIQITENDKKDICNPQTANIKPPESTTQYIPVESRVPILDQKLENDLAQKQAAYENAKYPVQVKDTKDVIEIKGSKSSAIFDFIVIFLVSLICGFVILYIVKRVLLYIILGPKNNKSI